jgi:3-hydroxyacyl-CoA dehydrogenase
VALITQAIVEDIAIKSKLYRELGSIVKPSGIFASNTSSFEIGFMSEPSGRPDRLVGMHFFNPVQIMKLVEVIRTPKTSAKVFDTAFRFGQVGWVG